MATLNVKVGDAWIKFGATSLVWRGSWSSVTAYSPGDVVGRDGSAFVCILAHTNQGPPNGSYWELLAAAGEDGAAGADGDDGVDGVGVPSGGTTGQALTKASDTDFNTEWATLGGGSGSAIVPLHKLTAGVGGAASFAFTSSEIPTSGYIDLEVRIHGKGTGTGGQAARVRANGDTGTNYINQQLYGYQDGNATEDEELAQNGAYLGHAPDSSSAVSFTDLRVRIPNFLSTFGHKGFRTEGMEYYGGSATGNLASRSNAAVWRNSAVITALTFYLASGNWAEGSYAVLYGVKDS